MQPPFDEVPAGPRHRLLGVDYVRLKGMQRGELFVTRRGWAGVMSRETMVELGREARLALRRNGWVVRDHKLRHAIMRSRPDGTLLS